MAHTSDAQEIFLLRLLMSDFGGRCREGKLLKASSWLGRALGVSVFFVRLTRLSLKWIHIKTLKWHSLQLEFFFPPKREGPKRERSVYKDS
jgi:hypothetical protein